MIGDRRAYLLRQESIVIRRRVDSARADLLRCLWQQLMEAMAATGAPSRQSGRLTGRVMAETTWNRGDWDQERARLPNLGKCKGFSAAWVLGTHLCLRCTGVAKKARAFCAYFGVLKRGLRLCQKKIAGSGVRTSVLGGNKQRAVRPGYHGRRLSR